MLPAEISEFSQITSPSHLE